MRRLRARLGAVERENSELHEELDALFSALSDPETAADYLKVTQITERIEEIKGQNRGTGRGMARPCGTAGGIRRKAPGIRPLKIFAVTKPVLCVFGPDRGRGGE